MVGGRRNKMKRTVAVGIIAVLACALFLVPYASANVGITCSVYPEEADFQSDFVYSITLTNPNYVTTGVLSLKVGSDSDNIDTTREWDVTDMELEPGSAGVIEKGKVRIEKGESCTVRLKEGVSFTHPKLKQGAFRDWTENPEDPEWDRAWYECSFTPTPFGEQASYDGFGEPILTHHITRFYRSSVKVEYNETGCLDKLSFDYEVKLWQNENKTIVLKARNYSTSAITDWDTKATYQDCPKGMHIIKFPNVTLNQDNVIAVENGAYGGECKFEGWNPSDEYIGPNITEKFSKLKVDPRSGTNTSTFNYSVNVDASICDKIDLRVFNHTTSEWDSKGTDDYKLGDKDPLKWLNITLNSHELDRISDSKFKFVGILCGAESDEIELPIWPINETWKNPTVKPESGLYNSKFTYCLDVKADKKLEVELIPYYHTKGKATIPPTEEYLDAGNWTTLCWNDIHPFEEKDQGRAEYKFKFYYGDEINDTEDHEGSRYSGPSIGIAEFKNNSVKPEYGTRETEFTYSVNVSAVESDYLTLKVYDSGGTLIRETKSDKKTSPNWEVFEFKSITFEHVPPAALGNASYEFWVKKTPSTDYVGPFLIIEKIGNLTVTPKEGTNATPFTFCVDVNSTEKENITLQVSSNETNWINVCSRPYENVSNEKHICFSDISVDSSNLTPEEKRNLTSEWKNKTIFWRVKGRIRESNTTSTNWDINLTCHKRSFSPKEGWWYQDNFTFQVNLSAEMNGNVELRIKLNESNSSWTTVGKREYNNSPNPQILTWEENVNISNSFIRNITYEGDTWYNFTLLWDSGEDSCGSESGPQLFIPLDIQLKNISVTPEVGVFYIENEILWRYFKNRNTNYTYCVNVSAAKDTRIRPVIIDPAGNRTTGYELGYSHGAKPGELCWNTSLSGPGDLCWGMWYYTFEYFDTRKEYETGDGWVEWQVQDGPEHLAVFKDFDIDPKPPLLYGESCNVSVVVNGSRDFDITLELWNETWCVHHEKKTYNSSKGEDRISWDDSIKPWVEFNSSDKLLFNFNVSGEPSLEDVSGGFSMRPAARNPKVTPGDGHWDTSYNYSVEIKFDREIDVELGILKRDGGYYEGGTKSYKKVTQWEPIYWTVSSKKDHEPFDQGCKMWESQFNVTWNGTPLYIREAGELKPIKIYGPYIWDRPPGVKFREGEVSMQEATYEDKLNYSVEVSVEPIKDVEVALWVYDPCHGDRFMGYGHHSGSVDGWQKFTWSNKMPFYDERCKAGHSEFWFKCYDRNDKFINESTKWQDPDLIPLIEFSNASVAPDTGEYDTRYNYSVNITINRTELVDKSKLKLVVWNPYTKSEQEYPSGNVTNLSGGVKKIMWSKTPFKDYRSCRGTAKYYFNYNGDMWPEKVLCDGPTIGESTSTSSSGGGGGGGGSYGSSEKIYDNASVKPDPVKIGIIRESKTLNYSVEETKNYKLILEIFNVSSEKWEEKGEGVKSKHNSKWKHEWTVNLTLDCNWEGRGKYRFYPEKQGKYASQVYYGPDYELKLPGGSEDEWIQDIPVSNTPLAVPTITANVEPEEGMWFKKFTYTANVKHPNKAKMTVALLVYKPGSDEWVPVAKGMQYNYIINTSDYIDEQDKTTVRWTLDWGNVFDEDDTGKKSRFYIWYWDGWNKIDCEKKQLEGYDEGPELLANGEPHVAKLPEFDYVGSTSTEFEYRFDVNDDNNDTVYGRLTVIDPLNNSHSLSKVEKTGNNGVASFCFTVDPDSEIFTEDKLKQYKNKTGNDTFTSRYRLEYWDECREMMGIGKRFLTNWFTGPTVTAVKVTYTEPEVSPNRGTYADEFVIRMNFTSSKTNNLCLTLTIYDPSNRSPPWSPPEGVVDLKVPAGQTEPVSWRVKPEIFGPEDAGKYVNYTIEGTDSFRRVYKINGNGSDLYIERAVPLLSLDQPLVPMVSMVMLPLVAFVTSLLVAFFDIPGRLKLWRKQKMEQQKEKKGKEET